MSGYVDVPGPGVRCPACGVEQPTTIRCTIKGEAMYTDADLSEVWSHQWYAHGVKP